MAFNQTRSVTPDCFVGYASSQGRGGHGMITSTSAVFANPARMKQSREIAFLSFHRFARLSGRGDPENLNKVAYLNIAVTDC